MEVTRKGTQIIIQADDLAVELKMYRFRQHLTQAELAKRWGLSRWSVMRVEAGKEVSEGLRFLVYSRLTEALRKELEQV